MRQIVGRYPFEAYNLLATSGTNLTEAAGPQPIEVDLEQANLFQRVSHELRGASITRALGASRG